MGRISANPVSYQQHQFQVQQANDQHQLQPHQEYTFQVDSSDHQAAETIDEIPPSSVEPCIEDLYPEESQNESLPQEPTMQSKAEQPIQQQQQSKILAPPPSPEQPTPALSPQPLSRPVTTTFQQHNANMINNYTPTQRPRQQPQPQAGTLRSSPQPSQTLPHAFPPAQDYYDFPPPQPQSMPQAFPPADHELHPFPPTPNSLHAFPPEQGGFPPQTESQSFVSENHNVPTFGSSQPQAGTNFAQYPHTANVLGQGAQIGVGMGHNQPQGMPPPQTPTMGIPKPQFPTESWKTGLFGCCEDPTNALITACFPCVTFGQIAEIVDAGQTSCGTSGLIYGAIAFFIAMPCIMSCTYRTKLRSRYGLIESPGPDWLIHCVCECCALCQEYRELNLRGLDPSIGWLGNIARKENMQLQQPTMAPPVHQTMLG